MEVFGAKVVAGALRVVEMIPYLVVVVGCTLGGIDVAVLNVCGRDVVEIIPCLVVVVG